MSERINIELDSKYAEHLELLKQIIPSAEGKQINDNSKMMEVLIDTFISFVQEQAWMHEHSHDEGGCCGGGSCGTEEKEHKHDNWHGGCGCSH